MTLDEYEVFLIAETEKIKEKIHNINCNIIQCRDCIYFKTLGKNFYWCDIEIIPSAEPQDYCSKGVRKYDNNSKRQKHGAVRKNNKPNNR